MTSQKSWFGDGWNRICGTEWRCLNFWRCHSYFVRYSVPRKVHYGRIACNDGYDGPYIIIYKRIKWNKYKTAKRLKNWWCDDTTSKWGPLWFTNLGSKIAGWSLLDLSLDAFSWFQWKFQWFDWRLIGVWCVWSWIPMDSLDSQGLKSITTWRYMAWHQRRLNIQLDTGVGLASQHEFLLVAFILGRFHDSWA